MTEDEMETIAPYLLLEIVEKQELPPFELTYAAEVVGRRVHTSARKNAVIRQADKLIELLKNTNPNNIGTSPTPSRSVRRWPERFTRR